MGSQFYRIPCRRDAKYCTLASRLIKKISSAKFALDIRTKAVGGAVYGVVP